MGGDDSHGADGGAAARDKEQTLDPAQPVYSSPAPAWYCFQSPSVTLPMI